MKETVVIVSDVDWNGHWVCEQQLASELAKYYRVIYIEQTRTFFAFLRPAGGDAAIGSKTELIKAGIRTIGDAFFAVSPPLVFPFRYFPLLYHLNSLMRTRWLRRLRTALGANASIVITFDPDSGGVLEGLAPKVSIYYKNDAHAKRNLWFNPNWLVDRRERRLMKSVDFVFALSDGLAGKSRELGVDTFVVPNGVDLKLFDMVRDSQLAEPSDMTEIPRPRVGLVGMLDWRIDLELLERLADRHPEWSIVLIGPANCVHTEPWRRLVSRLNVYYLGGKSTTEVPHYMKALDVGLIPYRLNEYTRQILSLKIFEYSALGIPTVATRMPELERYAAVVRLATNMADFEECVLRGLNSRVETETNKLIEFAEGNTWSLRAADIRSIISNHTATIS